jgi:N-acetyl-anhydromuramyl-L-alanine amidase AmpD
MILGEASGKLALACLLSCASLLGAAQSSPAAPRSDARPALAVKAYPIQSEARKELARAYSRLHYGIDSWRLESPRLVVVHYTATDSDSASLSTFRPAGLGSSRPDIVAGGALNVGVHYLIARDGTVWSLLSESDMGRHAVGYNHVALGIEMTGKDEKSLTEAQLRSCAALVADIAARNPSIAYMCGHHEYVQEGRAHYRLYKELMKDYPPPAKADPGDAFMGKLRAILKDEYSVTLLE